MNIGVISGASRGIGYAIAKELDNKGLDQLWVISRNQGDFEGFKTEIRHFPLDMTDSSFVEVIKSTLHEGEYKIKYLVCSAGVGYMGKVEDNTSEQISKMISLNCTALSLLTSVCVPYMDTNCSVIQIASGAGFIPQPNFAIYAATKSYVISFSRALRKELKDRKIHVTAVCPGPVETEFFASLGAPEYKKKYLISAEKVAKKAIKAARKNKAICAPTFSMKAVHLASKILPTSLLLKFYK